MSEKQRLALLGNKNGHGNLFKWSLAPHIERAVADELAYRRRFWPSEPFPFVSHRTLAEVFAAEPDDAA